MCGYCHLQMTSHRERSLATPQGSPLRGAQGSMFPSLQDPWSMEDMGHKVFGSSSPWRRWATGSLGIRPWALGDLPPCPWGCAAPRYNAGSVPCWLLGVSVAMPSRRAAAKFPKDPSRGSRREGAGDPGQGFDPPMGPPTVPLQAGDPLCHRTGVLRCFLCGVGANHAPFFAGSLG